MGFQELLKKAGKGLVITAASVVAGATLGPLAAGAVGGFLSKAMSQIGVTVSQEIVEDVIKSKIESSTEGLIDLVRPGDMEKVADEIAAKTNGDSEQIRAALQYSIRELQTNLNSIMMELRGDQVLLGQVLQLAVESGVKLDALAQQEAQTREAVEEVLRKLDAMERGLDVSYRKFIGKYSEPERLGFAKLMTISKLQRQRTVMASGFGVRYDPDLYVPRTEEEAVFERFTGDIGMSDRNIFLVLGNAGLGKTWFMARMSARALEMGSPTFFVPLAHGIKALTSVFQVETLPALVDLIDPVLDQAGEHAFIFLDGLDEMDPTNIKYILGGLASARSNSVSFVLSCRAADWATNKAIVRGSYDIKYFIYEDKKAGEVARGLRITTPVSVLMTEFTDKELSAAMQKYRIPRDVPEDLLPLLKRPYILRLSTEWYRQVGSLPSPSSPEFLDLFAGGPEYTDSVFRRLGILTERDSLFATVEKLIEAKRESLRLGELPMDSESSTFSTLVSSGLLIVTLDRSGTVISLSPEFLVPLCSLAILRYQSDPSKVKNLLSTIKQWIPDQALAISKIVNELVFPESITRSPEVRIAPPAPETPRGPVAPTPTAPRREPAPAAPSAPPAATALSPVGKRGIGQQLKPAEPAAGPTAPAAPAARPSTTPVPTTPPKRGLSQDYSGRTQPAPTAPAAPATPPKRGIGQAGSAAPSPATTPRSTPPTPAPSAPIKRGIAQFGAPSAEVVAVRVLTATDPAGIVKVLEPLLKDRDVHVRRAAVLGLGMVASKLKDPAEKIAILKPYLEDTDTDVRAGAVWGLTLVASTLKDDARKVELLRPYIDDYEWVVRRSAAFGLGLTAAKIEDAAKRTATLKPLYEHVDGQIRTGAVTGSGFGALRLAKAAEMVPVLTPFLDDSFDDVRGAAALSLGLICSAQADVASIVQTLKPHMVGGYGKLKSRSTLGMCLIGGKCGNAAQITADVAGLLKDAQFDVRGTAALGLGLASSGLEDASKVNPFLMPLLEDEEGDVRSMAALGLGLVASRLRDSDMIVLLRKLIDHHNEVVRSSGAIGMGIASTRFAKPLDRIALLKPLMNDPEKAVRKGALLGISLAATKLSKVSERVDLISPYIYDADPTIRRAAAIALGVATSEVELTLGTVTGDVLWGTSPLEHDECLVVGLSSCLTLVHGV